MKLTFTGPSATAAAVILAGTSLRHLVYGSGPLRLSDVDNDCGTLEVDLSWRWSSGEVLLINLLEMLSEGAGQLSISLCYIDARCDSETARVCREAVALLDAA
jgi:hypothetical protein